MTWIVAFIIAPAAAIVYLAALLYDEHARRQHLEAENWLLQQVITMLREELRAEQARCRQRRPIILNGRLYLTYRPTRLPFGRN